MDNRRVQRRKGELASELIAELDALGMSWNPLQENWQSGIAAARAFWEANGHLRVPRSFVAEDGFPLERWITLRRHARNRGRLTTERINALDALGMVWMPPRGAGT